MDRLAAGMMARGDQVSLLCGGPSGERPYEVVRSGGTYGQFVRAPLVYWRRLRDSDLMVEVCNGMPFFTPLWCGLPKICLVNHVHTELWRMMFPAPRRGHGPVRREHGDALGAPRQPVPDRVQLDRGRAA